MAATPLLNPRLVAHSEEVVKGWEGCLSVQGLRGLVPRYRAQISRLRRKAQDSGGLHRGKGRKGGSG
jgi:peptide deformylase